MDGHLMAAEPQSGPGTAIKHGEFSEAALAEGIRASRWILDLKDDHDGAGSPGYREETWQRAVDFVGKNAKWLWQHFHIYIELPDILPGPEGSIDLHWKAERCDLLVNIPVDPSAKATFYGEDRRGTFIKGAFDPGVYNQGLLLWLADRR
jgi:hypothetical protein